MHSRGREFSILVTRGSVTGQLSDVMDIFERFCGKATFKFLSLFIVTPGTNPLYRKIFVVFAVFVLSFGTIFQVLLLITEGFTLKLLVVLMPTIAAIFGSLIYVIYLTFATHIGIQYGKILGIMRYVLDETSSSEEIMIREQYATSTKVFINIYSTILLFMLFGMTVSGFVPSFLDIIMPLNHSRKNLLIYDGEIFIDQEKYFYHIYFLEWLSAVATVILVVVSVNMSVIVMQYSCSMSAVLGYQLETLTEIRIGKISEKMDYGEYLMKKIHMCIRSHQRIMELGLLIGEFYDIPLTLILVGSFCTLTMSLVQVTDPDLIDLKIIVYTIGQTVQLFLVSMMGQCLMDASLQTSEDAYNAEWDMCPGKVRKMLQFIILRASKPSLVMARGLYVLSVENFMSVMQTVMSFYMFLRHTR